ncbi:MAG: N-acylglucosamine 2-epimerase superfamily [Alphaproteobacteria bacterium]|nr:N-acylglucosamine 2-epimerase superfamily [Alphaproteobacteria bacterium]
MRHRLQVATSTIWWPLGDKTIAHPREDEIGASGAQENAALAAQMRESLRHDLLDRWFPACISAEGGFHENFDRTWAALPGETRSLVFQARMTWLAATVAAGGDTAFRRYARHGVAALGRMVHPESGALHWESDRFSRPCGRYARHFHAYGQAFAIFGLAAAAKVLGSQAALAAAQRIFAYLDDYHHDQDNGGYFEVTNLAGRRVLWGSWRMKHDAIGTRFGLKSQNTHLHLLEAFTELYRIWPDARLGLRLEELLALFQNELRQEPGRRFCFVWPDWRPVPGGGSYGHDVELAHLLLAAAEALGRRHDPALLARAKALVDAATDESWDEAGGLFDAQAQDRSLTAPVKTWWVQAEALASVAALHQATAEPRYLALLRAQWDWIASRQIDPLHGGWFESVAADGRPVGSDAKGKMWKDGYHEGRALIRTAAGLG